MPLSINVGLSRKASKDYQSTGCSHQRHRRNWTPLSWRSPTNCGARSPTSTARPKALSHQVSAVIDSSPPQQSSERQTRRPTNGNGKDHRNGNINGNGNGRSRHTSQGDGSMTESQRRAIFAIAQRTNVDATIEAREFIGTELDELSIRQASELIDHLKEYAQPANGNGR